MSFCETKKALTGGIFEAGAHGVPSKSQIPTILGQDSLFSTQCSGFEHWVLNGPP